MHKVLEMHVAKVAKPNSIALAHTIIMSFSLTSFLKNFFIK